MRRVCNRWRDSIDADTLIWKKLLFQDYPQIAALYASDPDSASVDSFKLFVQLSGLNRRGFTPNAHLEHIEDLQQISRHLMQTIKLLRPARRGPAVRVLPFSIKESLGAVSVNIPLLPPPAGGHARLVRAAQQCWWTRHQFTLRT